MKSNFLNKIHVSPLFFLLFFGLVIAVFFGLLIPFFWLKNWTSLSTVVVVLSVLGGGAWLFYGLASRKKIALAIFLGMTIFFNDAVFRSGDAFTTVLDAQSILKITIWLAAFFFSIYYSPNVLKTIFEPGIRWLTLFSVFAIVGTSYSLTPAYTFGAAVSMLFYCFFAVACIQNLDAKTILRAILFGFSFMLSVSLLMYAVGLGMVALENGTVLRLAGVAGSPNQLGRAASLTLIVATALFLDKHRKVFSWEIVLAVVLALICLQLSESRSSIAAFLFAVICFYLKGHGKVLLSLIGILLVVLIIFLNINFSFQEILSAVSRTGRASEILTLTGRTPIWAASMEAFFQQPWFGYGFGSTKELLPLIYRGYWGFMVVHAHNMYIQTLLITGVVGFVLLMLCIISLFIRSIKAEGSFPFLFLFFMLLYGVTEPGPMGTSTNVMTFLFAIALAWPIHRKMNETKE